MKANLITYASCTLFVLLLVAACSDPSKTDPAKSGPGRADSEPRLTVYTVNYPLYEMTRRIGGDHFQVELPDLEGDPAFWQPDVETVLAYQQADLILKNGADYAKWMAKVSLPQNKLVDTSAAFAERYIYEAGPTHSHGPGGEHAHTGVAFTTWLDMQQAIEQARAIHVALIELKPAAKQEFDRNLDRLTATLKGFDQRLKALGEALNQQAVLYSHPIYQYFQRAYQINGKAVLWEPDEFPDDHMWQELMGLQAKSQAKLMLWEDTPLPQTADRLSKLGITLIVFSQIPNRPEQGDFVSLMDENITRLEQDLKKVH